MAEYLMVFLILFLISILLYLLYDRYFKKTKISDSALYTDALKDLLDGKQESAFGKLRQLVAEDTSNIDAYLRLGKILRENNRTERALQVHKDLTVREDLGPDNKIAILRELFLDYELLDDKDMAQSALREIIDISPRDYWAYVQLLKMQESTADWEEAFETASKLLKLEANKSKKPLAKYKYHLAEQFLKKRDYHKCRVLFKEAVSLDPTFELPYLAIGDSYLEEERFEDAVNIWNKLIDVVPSKGHLVIDRLKKTLFDLGRFGDIIIVCKTILENSNDNLPVRYAMAEFYLKKGEIETAVSNLKEILDISPGDIAAVLKLIKVYMDKGDNAKVYELLKKAESNRGADEHSSRPDDKSEVAKAL